MTPKEMQELDAWIAENVMDWKLHYSTEKYMWAPGHIVPYTGDWWVEGESVKYEYQDWHPAINIVQAFEVVDKLNKKGYYVEIGIWGNETECYCTLVGEIVHDDLLATLRDDCFTANADTPALAICLSVRKINDYTNKK